MRLKCDYKSLKWLWTAAGSTYPQLKKAYHCGKD